MVHSTRLTSPRRCNVENFNLFCLLELEARSSLVFLPEENHLSFVYAGDRFSSPHAPRAGFIVRGKSSKTRRGWSTATAEERGGSRFKSRVFRKKNASAG